MILRRPYAFLIKHFKLIHLFLFLSFGILTYQASTILNFFKDYIKGNIVEIIATNYIKSYVYILAVVITALSLIIYFLMKYKEKPRLIYILNIITIIFSSVCFAYLYSKIKVLEISPLEAKTVRFLRDISRFNFWFLLVMTIPSLIRTLGFDIKKFNFSKDLEGLKLEEKDNEEVEVNIDLKSDKVKRGYRSYIRELGYYYTENKFFINIIITIVAIIILFFPFNKYIINRTRSEDELIKTEYFSLKVTDSYITTQNQTSKDKEYLILKFSIKGKYQKYSLKTDYFVLKADDKEYVPSLKYYLYFDKLGIGYKNQEISTDTYMDYLLIYNIDMPTKENAKYILEYLVENKKIKLSPQILD